MDCYVYAVHCCYYKTTNLLAFVKKYLDFFLAKHSFYKVLFCSV